MDNLSSSIIINLCQYLHYNDILKLQCISKYYWHIMNENCIFIWKYRCLLRWDELQFATQIKDNEWKSIYLRKQKEETDLQSFMNMKQFKSCDWYSCPNGHLYLIGECRLPMAVGKCPTCGVRIGGKSHRMLEDNKRLGRVNRDNLKGKSLNVEDLSASLLTNTLDHNTIERNRKITPIISLSAINKSKSKQKKNKRNERKYKEENIENLYKHDNNDDYDMDMDMDMDTLFQ